MRRANIYVGQTPNDFLNDEALMCQRDLTVGLANNIYLAACQQPIKGRYFTIKNYANLEFDETAKAFHGPRQCLNLCEVDIYLKGRLQGKIR